LARHRAAGAHVPADVEPRAAGHHDVQDQQVEAWILAAQLRVGVLAVDRERDLKPLLLERVADRFAYGGLVVCDEDSVGH
jgi:hypothetical protein